MRNKESGYINLDFNSLFIASVILGGVVFVSVWELLQFVWPYVKVWIHNITQRNRYKHDRY